MYFDSSRHAEIIKYLEYPDFAELIFAAAVVSEPEANVIPVVFRVMPKNELVEAKPAPCPGTAANRFDQWPGDMFNRPTSGACRDANVG